MGGTSHRWRPRNFAGERTMTDTGTIRFEDPAFASGWTQVPNVILRAPGLKPAAKIVYQIILSYAWQKDRAWPGIDRLAYESGTSRTTVWRATRELQAQGLIEVESHQAEHRPNVYVIKRIPAEFYQQEQPQAFQIETDQPPTFQNETSPHSNVKREEDSIRIKHKVSLQENQDSTMGPQPAPKEAGAKAPARAEAHTAGGSVRDSGKKKSKSGGWKRATKAADRQEIMQHFSAAFGIRQPTSPRLQATWEFAANQMLIEAGKDSIEAARRIEALAYRRKRGKLNFTIYGPQSILKAFAALPGADKQGGNNGQQHRGDNENSTAANEAYLKSIRGWRNGGSRAPAG